MHDKPTVTTHQVVLDTLADEVRTLSAENAKLHAQLADLLSELAAVLDVAVARGEQLDYEDEDYHERLDELAAQGVTP